MTASMRTVYAQSSDIKSRTWQEYRLDMKKKAIAELEFVPFLEKVLKDKHSDAALRVKKHGGDAELWFNASGQGVTGSPDYLAKWGDSDSHLYEFQLAENIANLKFFDFKVSKVGKKPRGKARVPYNDRDFFYVIKDTEQYAFVTPEWIAQKGQIQGVPAWGNRAAYRVCRDWFLPLFVDGGADLKKVLEIVERKNYLLNFQLKFMEQESCQLSRELQQVVDEKRLLSIVPRTMEGFYRVCFLLDRIGKQPDAPGVWMVYLMSFFNADMRTADFARYIYALDFLYFTCQNVQKNEQIALEKAIIQSMEYVERRFATTGDSVLKTASNEAPIEALRKIVFAVNLLEDIKQNAAVNLDLDVPKAVAIFDMVPNVSLITDYIRQAEFPS